MCVCVKCLMVAEMLEANITWS